MSAQRLVGDFSARYGYPHNQITVSSSLALTGHRSSAPLKSILSHTKYSALQTHFDRQVLSTRQRAFSLGSNYRDLRSNFSAKLVASRLPVPQYIIHPFPFLFPFLFFTFASSPNFHQNNQRDFIVVRQRLSPLHHERVY